MKNKALYDLEVYPNYMLFGMKDLKGDYIQISKFGVKKSFSKKQISDIKELINQYQLIGFNSMNYDDVVLTYMLQGEPCDEIYHFSKAIVEEGLRRWDAYEAICDKDVVESIDLIEIAHGQASLKLYGTRVSSKQLQDLPYDPHKEITKKQANEVAKYNKVDLDVTHDLYNKLVGDVMLREKLSKQYNTDLKSKSDAQMAEAIFRVELKKKGVKATKTSGSTVFYQAPKPVVFKSKKLNKLVRKLEQTPILLAKNGSPMLPKWLKDEKIQIGETIYNIGLGGLHSTEKSMMVIPKDNETLGNVDVASYYPSLIVELGLYPKHLSDAFLDIYTKVKTTRLEAKRLSKDETLSDKERETHSTTNESLKIVLNGSYGKFGSNYSFLYSPDLLLTVTFTGQLYLLMLIESLENSGKFKVVSSNTDGVELVYKKNHQKKLEKIVSKWEHETKMDMEYGTYKALYARDVNSYVAIYDGYVKAKGAYADPFTVKPKLSKNVEYPIVFEAIKEFLLSGKPMQVTLDECEDPVKFTSARAVTGGGVWGDDSDIPNTDEYENYLEKIPFKQNMALEKRNDKFRQGLILASDNIEYLGKTVRWYYAKGGSPIYYKKSGNRVPKTDGSKPMMKLKKKIPKDLDMNKYMELCNKHLAELGYI